MRKRLFFLAVAALAGVALLTAACGDDDDNGGTATATKAATGAATTAAATATGAASSTAPAGTAAAQDITIKATDFAFDKTSISAAPGQAINITLDNNGAAEHSFTVGDADVTEAEGGEHGSGSFTASTTTVEFHCKYHPSVMKGTITISGATSENLSPTATAASGGGIGGYGY